MGLFKNYVIRIMEFFVTFTYVTLYQFYSIISPVLLKLTNYGMREKKIFCIYECFSISR